MIEESFGRIEYAFERMSSLMDEILTDDYDRIVPVIKRYDSGEVDITLYGATTYGGAPIVLRDMLALLHINEIST